MMNRNSILEVYKGHKILKLEEWKTYSPEEYPELKNLKLSNKITIKDFLNNLKKQYNLTILELDSGLYIKTSYMVGFVQLGNMELVISPKIENFSLMKLMSYVFNLHHIKFLDPSYYKFDEFGFLDLLIFQLEKEIKNLERRGLHKTYNSLEDDLAFIKGKINIKRIISEGGIHKAKIPCNFYQRSENNLFNRILISGLIIGKRLTNQKTLKISLNRLIRYLETNIDPINLNQKLFTIAFSKLNRLTRLYEPILKIIYLLWKTLIPNISGISQIQEFHGFLFDMNKFFEELLYRFLNESLTNLVVKHWYKFSNMISYLPEYNPKRRRDITLHPDYVILKDGISVAVLDAKYRDLWEKNLPIKWLYQLSFYALNPIAKNNSIILYPTSDINAKDAKIEIKKPLTNNRLAIVIIRPVIIPKLVEILDLKNLIEMQKYALSLINK